MYWSVKPLPSSIARSIVFDMNILAKGLWTEEEKNRIEEWIKEDGFEEKQAVASNLISHMITTLLGEDCSKDGYVRSKRLGEMMRYFEGLLATTKGGIAKKFYRDHLNHMLRVMLLANAIGKNIRSFALSEDEIRLTTLAGLVHDIAYPLSESYQILNETKKAITKCYEALSFPEFIVSYNMERVTKLIEILDLECTPLSFFGSFLNEYNHGLMGAIEFFDYINPEEQKKYTQLLRAIVFHDSSLKVPDFLKEDPILLVLVLSDELQDWGRPAGLEKEPAISEIDNFKMNSHRIQGSFKWRSSVNVSPLRQIFAKVSNFRRFTWPTSLNVSLKFKLPNYSLFDSKTFDEITNSLIEYCRKERPEVIQNLNTSWEGSKELFKSFYGNTLPETDDLIKYLCQAESSKQWQKSIYFASERKEILYITQVLGKPSELKLEIKSGDIELFLRGEREYKGYLYYQGDSMAKQPAGNLIARLIVFHGLASRIASKNVKGLVERYPYPSQELIEKAMQTVGVKKNTNKLIENLRGLRKCLVQEGFFLFESEEKTT